MSLSLDSIKQPFWAMKPEEVFTVLESSILGLSDEEAERRLKLFGKNEITEKRPLAKFSTVINQFRSPLILILMASGMITFFLREWMNTVVIFAAVTVNVFLGFYQENKAETALGLLRSYIRTRTRVKRSGVEREVDAVFVVPGDILRITQGDRIPADSRVIFANNLELDESILTGESLPVLKDSSTLAPGVLLSDRKSMVFSGTLVVEGFGDVIVTATSNSTEFGKIAALVANRKPESTPLQRAISRFAFFVGVYLAGLVGILFVTGILRGYGVFEMFLIGVAVAVSAVPEGLPIALTVILSIGVLRLAQKKSIVRRLLAAETLGSTTLILTDKTGTLTQARMEIASVIPYGEGGAEAEKKLLSEALFNTDVVIENPGDPFGQWKIVGRALEVALVHGSAERGVLITELLRKRKVQDRLPFSSKHKFSASLSDADPHGHLVLMGAPEIILNYTNFPDSARSSILRTINDHAQMGERVLGIVEKHVSREHAKINKAHLFDGFNFLGLITLRDPLRPGVKNAIQHIASSGVKTIILTGDHEGTAEAVARDLGLIDGKGSLIRGDDLKYLEADELKNRAGEVTVYARVTLEQKVMITKLYQGLGNIVAVTGDGVNDAPALQVADIGVAVGSGTDVAKNAADLVLLDDNFETLVFAIEEGRKILDNIRKVVIYLLSDSLDELLLIGGSLILGIALPLNALQILFVNFFSDSFPAIGFAFEKGVDGAGSRPRTLGRNILDRQLSFLILVIGVFTSTLLFFLYWYLLHAGYPQDLVRSFIFATFATYSLFLVFPLRSLEKSILSYNPFSNMYLIGGVILGLGLTFLVIYVPLLQSIFETVSLPPLWFWSVLSVGAFNILAVEFGKWLFRRKIL